MMGKSDEKCRKGERAFTLDERRDCRCVLERNRNRSVQSMGVTTTSTTMSDWFLLWGPSVFEHWSQQLRATQFYTVLTVPIQSRIFHIVKRTWITGRTRITGNGPMPIPCSLLRCCSYDSGDSEAHWTLRLPPPLYSDLHVCLLGSCTRSWFRIYLLRFAQTAVIENLRSIIVSTVFPRACSILHHEFIGSGSLRQFCPRRRWKVQRKKSSWKWLKSTKTAGRAKISMGINPGKGKKEVKNAESILLADFPIHEEWVPGAAIAIADHQITYVSTEKSRGSA